MINPSDNNSNPAWAVIAAGGTSERFAEGDKLSQLLGGLPVLVRTVVALFGSKKIGGAVIVAHRDNLAAYRQLMLDHRPEYLYSQYASQSVILVPGGSTRRESVYQGLKALPKNVKTVLIHDAARPLLNPVELEKAIAQVDNTTLGIKGVIFALPMTDTVKISADGGQSVSKTLDRTHLWRAQTPQVFPLDLILKAHETVDPTIAATDDAQLMELAGIGPVYVMAGETRNLKITVPEDLIAAETLLQAR